LASGCNSSWLLEGSRMLDALALAEAPGFERRLRPVHAFLIASQDRERQRLEAEEEGRRAELRAAEERARHAQERESTAQTHAAMLSRRQTVLRRVLMATAVIAVVAVVGGLLAAVSYVRATNSERQAQSRFRDATAARLDAEAERLLARPGSEVPAFQRILAAHAVADNPDEGTLYSVVLGHEAMRRVLTPGLGSILDVTRDGGRFVAVEGSTLRLYDSATAAPAGQPLQTDTSVDEAALSDDGGRVAVAGGGTIRVWNTDTGQPVGPPIETGAGSSPKSAISGNGELVAGAGDDVLQVWNATTGAPVGPPVAVTGMSVNTVALTADGSRVAAGGGAAPYPVQVWDAASGAPVGPPLIPDGGIDFSLVFSPDGNRIAVGSANRVLVWDTTTGELVTEDQDGETWATSLGFSPDGNRIAAGHFNGSIRLWDIPSKKLVGSPRNGHTDQVNAVAFSADSQTLTSVGRDGNVRIWNVDVAKPLIPNDDPVVDMVVSPDGKRLGLVVAPLDGYLQWYDAGSGAEVGDSVSVAPEMARTIIASPDGGRAASVATSHRPYVIDTVHDESCALSGTGSDGVQNMSFSRDGALLASGNNDGENRVWDAVTCKAHGALLAGQRRFADGFAFTPDGSRLVVAFGNGDMQFFDPKTGEADGDPLTGHSLAVTAMAFSPDGAMLVSGSGDQTLRRWDVKTHQPIGGPMAGHADPVVTLAFSPDGSHIVSGAGDSFRVWDAKTGRAYGDQFDTTGTVDVVAFNPDGTHFYSSGFDGDVVAWPATASPDDLCAKLTRNITKREWREWVSPDIPYEKVCTTLPDPSD